MLIFRNDVVGSVLSPPFEGGAGVARGVGLASQGHALAVNGHGLLWQDEGLAGCVSNIDADGGIAGPLHPLLATGLDKVGGRADVVAILVGRDPVQSQDRAHVMEARLVHLEPLHTGGSRVGRDFALNLHELALSGLLLLWHRDDGAVKHVQGEFTGANLTQAVVCRANVAASIVQTHPGDGVSK